MAGAGGPTSAVDRLVVPCAKMVLLDKLLTRLKEEGHRVLIFSQVGPGGAARRAYVML